MRLTLLEVINNYYLQNRQVGHTTTMLNGAAYTPTIILVGTKAQAEYIQQMSPSKKLTIMTMESAKALEEKLRGCRAPLVVDNVCWYYIMKDVDKACQEMLKKGEYNFDR